MARRGAPVAKACGEIGIGAQHQLFGQKRAAAARQQEGKRKAVRKCSYDAPLNDIEAGDIDDRRIALHGMSVDLYGKIARRDIQKVAVIFVNAIDDNPGGKVERNPAVPALLRFDHFHSQHDFLPR